MGLEIPIGLMIMVIIAFQAWAIQDELQEIRNALKSIDGTLAESRTRLDNLGYHALALAEEALGRTRKIGGDK